MNSLVKLAGSRVSAERETASPSVLVGLIGRGIQFSRSPAMHEAEGRAQGFSYIYRLLDTDLMGARPPDLSDLIRYAELFGFAGINITHPYKQEVIGLLDELSPAAESVGAVNTVVLRSGRRVGDNTDLSGFRSSFEGELNDVKRDVVLLLGAGGAGSAVARALLESGVRHLKIFDADDNRARALVSRLAEQFGADRAGATDDVAQAIGGADGLVNATPVGMTKRPGVPIALELLHRDLWIADVVYFPLETELIRQARALGCRVMNGGGMAVFQAAQAFRLFTGRDPDIDRMRASFAAWRAPSPEEADP